MRNPFNIFKHLPHLLRKKFDEKYIIIESDDWGLERALNKDSVKWMERKYGLEKLSRWSYDSLESREDLNGLYEILEKYKTKFEFPPVITANFITHNVNYSSKEDLDFMPLKQGFNKQSEDVRDLYKKGINNNYIFPQLHGYSHYDVTELAKFFKTDEGKESFNKDFFTARSTTRGNLKFCHGELSNLNGSDDKIKEAAEAFKNFFGFYSSSIIPPTFILDRQFINSLKANNITMIQSSNRLVTSDNKRFSYPNFQKRKGIYWSVRNARLDPHPDYKFYYQQCLESIGRAFVNETPAVIDFHRVNISGRYAPEYRDRTFKELKLLLNSIHDKWPEARFIHSQKLNEILWQPKTK